jgi:uncharacterized protein YndB with AHSA1/START domain
MFQSHSTFTISAPIQDVWDGLTNPQIVAQYFFGTKLESSWQVGSTITFSGEWEGKPYIDKGIIKQINPPFLLQYNYRSSWSPLPDVPENYLLVEYALLQNPDGTTELVITQDCVDQKSADESSANWKNVMQGMIEIVEK